MISSSKTLILCPLGVKSGLARLMDIGISFRAGESRWLQNISMNSSRLLCSSGADVSQLNPLFPRLPCVSAEHISGESESSRQCSRRRRWSCHRRYADGELLHYRAGKL